MLTVRVQALDPSDMKQLKWETFFPRADVPSTKIKDVLTLDDRFVSDRREWNAQGRQIPLRTPDLREISFTPIQAYQRIAEQELNEMAALGGENEQTVAQIIGVPLPQRIESMAMANYRRLEVDCINAWTQGKVIQRNPETGATYDISFGFDAGRITTVGTAWTDGATNAYNEFIAFAKSAQSALGVLAGFVAPRAVWDAILADSPVNAITGRRLKLADLVQDVRDELGTEINIGIWEESGDVFTDGGTATTRTKYFPAGTMAAVPAGGAVGKSAFAPVYRARSIAQEVPEARVDVNGQAAFYVSEQDGMILKPTVQLNAFPVPDEEKVFVVKGLLG